MRAYRYLIPPLVVALAAGIVLTLAPGDVGATAGDPVIAAAGDIACDPAQSGFNGGAGTANSCHMRSTSDLMLGAGLAAVLPLGDNQYYCGSLRAYQQSYAQSWGRLLAITHPAVGNHEYLTSPAADRTDCTTANAGAAGYFDYFGAAAGQRGQGYYSYDLGSWHLIALNTNCTDAGGCSNTSPQGKWLAADLAADAKPCTLAYWHIPLYSSGGRANANSKALWTQLYNAHADVVLTGHDHDYERFALQNATAGADPAGIREFVVGTGGANHTSFTSVAANSQVRDAATFGVLMMTLRSTGYDWSFVPEPGKTFRDSGSMACHRAGGDVTAPTTPAPFTATPVGATRVDLGWGASTDTGGVAGYRVYRDGLQIGQTTANVLQYSDLTAAAATTYIYSVAAFDGSGNTSSAATAVATTGADPNVLTFAPTADAYVDATTPTTNFGAAVQLVADASPQRRSLLRFTVAGLGTRHPTSVTLRLYCVNGSATGGTVHRVANTSWGETTVTWNNAPAGDPATIATVGPVHAGTWYDIDVSGVVTGDGTYTVDLTSTNADGAYFGSRQGTTAQAPQLVVHAGA